MASSLGANPSRNGTRFLKQATELHKARVREIWAQLFYPSRSSWISRRWFRKCLDRWHELNVALFNITITNCACHFEKALTGKVAAALVPLLWVFWLDCPAFWYAPLGSECQLSIMGFPPSRYSKLHKTPSSLSQLVRMPAMHDALKEALNMSFVRHTNTEFSNCLTPKKQGWGVNTIWDISRNVLSYSTTTIT